MERQPLELRSLPRRALDVTAEDEYWDSFELAGSRSHFGQIKFVHFCPQPPFDFAVSCLDQVAVYHGIGYGIHYRETHFKDGVNCCQFRADGRLMVAAGNDPVVRVWSKSVSLVRLMRGHTAPIHITAFLPSNVHVMSTSDDMTARIWDLATQETIATLMGHADYVRAGGPHPTNPHLLATGGYDHAVRVWDTRVAERRCALELRHPNPVETLAWHPSGTFIAAAAGNVVSIWDVVSGRAAEVSEPHREATDAIFGPSKGGPRPQFTMCNHQRTIPTLTYTHSGARLLTGGLDDFVKVYNTATYTIVHSLPFPAAVQALALSPDERTLVVGMVDGKVAIHRRPAKPQRAPRKDEVFEHHGGYLFHPAERHRWRRRIPPPAPAVEELRIETQRAKRLRPFDRDLARFRYHRALDTALQLYQRSRVKGRPPSEEPQLMVVTVLEELYRRNALRHALHARTDNQLLPTLRFIRDHILDPRYCPVLSTVVEVVLEIYAGVLQHSPGCEAQLLLIHRRVRRQLRQLREMAAVDGMLDCVMEASDAQTARREQLQRQADPLVPAAT